MRVVATISSLCAGAMLAACTTTSPIQHLPALRGDHFVFESRTLERSFHIFVRLPENHGTALRHPSVYVLDGDSLFPIIAAGHLFLTIDDGRADAVVIGIAYGSFDPGTNKRGTDFAVDDGAAAFHSFLVEELVPEVERRYRVDPARRILFGQSRGGDFVLYSAFTDPDVFWGRIASNASFGPGAERFFERPADASRDGLWLTVASGSGDRPEGRAAVQRWWEYWNGAAVSLPWALHTPTIPGGTHSADAFRSYREALRFHEAVR